MCKKVVCFDLDDTLYKEIDFVESAYGEIASFVGAPKLVPMMMKWFHDGDNVFQKLNQYTGQEKSMAEYLTIYRNHVPNISLLEGVEETLDELTHRGVILGLITDGRSISQRNKIKALGMERWFEDKNIIISEEFGSEKTDERNFRCFMDLYPGFKCYYVGDNPEKDFVVPNRMGWQTVMIKDNGQNIHKQNLDLPNDVMPKYMIKNIVELLDYIN